MARFFHSEITKGTVRFFYRHGIFIFVLAACSAGQTNSLDGEVQKNEAKNEGNKSDPQTQNQAAASSVSQEKECSFRYQGGAGPARLEWASENEVACKTVCESQKPIGVTGICYFKENPLGVDLSQPPVDGNWNIRLPQQPGVVQQTSTSPFNAGQAAGALTAESLAAAAPASGCALVEVKGTPPAPSVRPIATSDSASCKSFCDSAGLSQGASLGHCLYDRQLVLSLTPPGLPEREPDSNAAIALCELSHTDAQSVAFKDTLQTEQADCSQRCMNKLSANGGAVSLECAFNGVVFQKVSVGSGQQENAMGSAPAPAPCSIESKKRAMAGLPTATFTSRREAPDRTACAYDCEQHISPELIGLTCTFGDSDTLARISLGASADDPALRNCLTSSTIGTSTTSRSSVMTLPECRALCLEMVDQGADSVVCQFGP